MVSKKVLCAVALSFVTGGHAATAMRQVEVTNHATLASEGWTVEETSASLESIVLRIALAFKNTDKMISTLLDVSNPKSKNYGKWLDRDDVNSLVQPDKKANDAVVNWLKSEGISKVTSDGTEISFKTSIKTANRILNANFQRFKRGDVTKVRTIEYSVPQDLAEHIDLIHPTTFFGKSQPFAPVHSKFGRPFKRTNRASELQIRQQAGTWLNPNMTQQTVGPICSKYMTPSCLKQLYNVGNYTASVSSGSRIGFGSFLNQSAQFQDLKLYERYYNIAPQSFTKVEVTKGAAKPKELQYGEANLDVQNMVGVAHPLPVTEFLTGGSPPFIPDLEMNETSKNTNEPYLPYYQFLLSRENSELPQVISTSYGEPERTVPPKYAERTCTMIAMMGLRGVTIMESSGDSGIGAACLTNDGKKEPRFDAQFPGTCPWLTSVGGTQAVNPEIAWEDSSGGFSDQFPRPAYQEDALKTYFSEHAPAAVTTTFTPYFNKAGRAFPDISAHSLSPSFFIAIGGVMTYIGGTSASAPVMASLVGLLNDARLKAGLTTMGFINPWLYGSGSDFIIDIATGGSRGCDGTQYQTGEKLSGSGIIPGAGWNATIGWDPVTGLGIPDFQKMLASATLKST